MKKTTFLKSLFLLFALIVGSTSVWADEVTFNATTDVDANVSNYQETEKTYTSSSDGSSWVAKGFGATKNTCLTLGKGNANYLKTPVITGTITSIKVNAKSSNSYYLKIVDNSGNEVCAQQQCGTSYADKTFTVTSGSYTQLRIIAKKQSATSNAAVDIKSVVVTYSSSPIINASSPVNYAADITSGEIPYTISNSVSGKFLNASSEDTWISNISVGDEKVTFTMSENTGEAREGKITLSYEGATSKDITINQAAAETKYTVTIEAPTNGTLVVKRGETAISSGAQIPDGTELTIETTPAENYRLRNWQAVDGSTHTYTATFTYTINASNVTIRANFELIPEHTASFYVNGTKVSEAVVKEDAAITFPAVSNIGNDELAGWVTEEIEGYQAAAPTFKTTMGNADANYYAVFAHVVDALFDAADITYTPQGSDNLSWTHTASGAKLSLSDGQRYISATPYTFTVKKGTSNYFQVNAPTNTYLSGIVVKISESKYKINSVQTGASLSTSGTTQTVSFTADNKSSMRCYATSNDQIRATEIYVTAKGYCTSIPTATISINEACTDGEGNYYGTYSKGTAFIVPADLTVSSVSVDDEGKLVVTPYNTGDIVKANTGVMVSSTSAGNKTVYLSSTNTGKAGNMLKGTGDAAVTAAAMATAAPNCKYYRLTMHNGTTIGYYWGAAEGAAFAIPGNKAYLAVPEAQAARMSGFALDNTATGINGVEEIAPVTKTRKVVKNGRLVIETANGEFTIDGARMK